MNWFKNKLTSKKAFTFVEILITIFICGVGILPVLTIFLTGTRTVESGGNVFEVAVAAQNIMDTVRSDTFMWQEMPVNIIIPLPPDSSVDANTRGLYLPADLINKYKAKCHLHIDNAKDIKVLGTGAPETNLYQIDIEITWVENGKPKKYTLMNYRANTNTQNMKTSTRF